MHRSDPLFVPGVSSRSGHREPARIVQGAATQADPLWTEHGWALGGNAVGVILGIILAVSVAAQLLG